jgi:hypothetical protein
MLNSFDFNKDNILNAYNFQKLSDIAFNFIEDLQKPYDLNKNLVIFCKTDFLPFLFKLLENNNHFHILITHHSDYSINDRYYNIKPRCIKKWFCINSEIYSDDIIPIPLGLKTHTGAYLEPQYKTEWFSENINSLRNNSKSNNIYCNWNITNHNRTKLVESLNYLSLFKDCNLPFELYIENMSKCKFVLSPPGNGIDCHRTWEALYVNSIPIVLKNKIYDYWSDLPILQVSNFSDLTNDLLNNFSKNTFNFGKLNIQYWSNLIIKYKNEINAS